MERAVIGSSKRWRLRLAPALTAPRAARDFVMRACAAWHGEQYVETAQLVVSELVSNAVIHSGTVIEVEMWPEPDGLWLRVHDEGDGLPALAPQNGRDIGGVGLDLVSRLSQSWGVTLDPRGGKDVWCILPASSG